MAIELPDKDLTAGIISVAIAVHRIPGPGFLESIMKATNVDSGLLPNFAAMPLTVKRVGREHPNPS